MVDPLLDSVESAPPLVEVRRLCKSYRRGTVETQVLRDVDLQLPAGSFNFIVGPSGSGKSTLLYLLGGLDRPTSGEILLGGQPISSLPPRELDELRRHQIGFIFQSFNLLKTMTCLENVLAPFIPTGRAASMRPEAERLLQLVGLGERLQHRQSELSGGEQQRVAIARAILKKPRLILADEPTGELDTQTGQQVFRLLRQLHQEQQTTVVTVTHDQRYIEPCDTVLQMQDGRLMTNGEAIESQ